jgi:hypothetical protein
VSLPEPPSAPARVSTAGAWLGVGIGARAALGAAGWFVPLLLVAGIPLVVDVIDRNARAQEVPPEVVRVTDLWLDLAQILGPYARAAGGAGVLIAVSLFVASGFLVRGADLSRKVVRGLLVAGAAHSIVAAVWLSSIAVGPLAEWTQRYVKALTELQDAIPGIEDRFPGGLVDAGWLNVATCVVMCVVSLALDGVLFWLAGRKFARDWCAARAVRRPVAADAAPASRPS